MKKVLFIVTVLIALSGLAVVFFGRGLLNKAKKEVTNRAAKEVLEQQTGADVDLDVNFDTNEGKMSLTKDGSTIEFSGQNELPPEFPEDIPIYKNSKIEGGLSATSETEEGAGGITVAISSPANAETLYAFYRAMIIKNEWSLETSVETEGNYMVGGSKGNRQLIITLQPHDNPEFTKVGILSFVQTEETKQDTPPEFSP